MPLSVFRAPALTGACLVAFVLTATTSAASVLVSLHLQDVLSRSPAATG